MKKYDVTNGMIEQDFEVMSKLVIPGVSKLRSCLDLTFVKMTPSAEHASAINSQPRRTEINS